MAIYNTSFDAANTAVRSFLTKVGEVYAGRTFNTSQGRARENWTRIKIEVFDGCCAYCGSPTESPTIEHLIMFNRAEFGLHHPGNCVPACRDCNSSRKKTGGAYPTWEQHLQHVCERRNEMHKFDERRRRIAAHHSTGEFAYPRLSDVEKHAIRVIAETLYKNVQAEVDKSLELYRKLDDAFIQGRGSIATPHIKSHDSDVE